MAVLLQVSALEPLEQIAYRTRFQVRGECGWDDRVVLIAIDDSSLKQLGRFPWPRQYYAHLLEILAAAEPSAIAINLLWSEPSPHDPQLAAAMLAQGRVILAQARDFMGNPLPPVPELREAAIAVGHIMQSVDSDGIARTIAAEVDGYSALGIVSAQVHALTQETIAQPPVALNLWINWPGAAHSLQHYSFVDVIEGRVPLSVFHDKIVLLGVTATGIDPLATPFDQSPPASSVYIHAAVIDNLLNQRFLVPLPEPGLVWLLLLLGGPGLGWVMSYRHTRHQLLILGGLVVIWCGLDMLLFQVAMLLPIAYPIILFSTTGLAVAVIERLRENYLLKAQIEQLWAAYHQDLVIRPADATPIVPTPIVPLGSGIEAPRLSILPSRSTPARSRLRIAQLTALAEQFGRSQSTQAAIARNLSIGLLAADLDGHIWFCNPQASRWLQAEVGQNLSELLVPCWLSQSQWQAAVQHLTLTSSVITRELKQGNNWFEMILEPLVYHLMLPRNLTPAPNGLLLLLEDINHRKQIEADLQQAKEAAEAASRAKGEFLANMSHELRTPLNIILGFVQLMRRDTTMTPENTRYINIINRSGQDLLNLINEVLEMSKLEAGELRLNEHIFDLYELLNNLQEMLQVKVESKQITLSFDCHEQVPRYIKTDEHKLRQVLLNLLGNAIKFTEKGSITCRIFPVNPLQDDRNANRIQQLQFEVEDTGPGIAAAEIHKLFQPFSQTQTGEASHEGTGLGLAISRRLVSLMGGNIAVTSTVGQGSTFRFTLPIQPIDLPVLQPLASDCTPCDLALMATSYRILVVDDSWDNRHALEQILEQVGFTVRTAKTSAEGFSLWQHWCPHLVFIDIQMSVIDGYELIHKVRTQEHLMRSSLGINADAVLPLNTSPDMTAHAHSLTILIATSANVFTGTHGAILAAGFNDFLQSPIAKDELLNKIARYLPIADRDSTLKRLPQPRSLKPPPVFADPRVVPSTAAPVSWPAQADLVQALRTLPPDWLEQLAQAAIRGSDDRITQLLQELSPSQTALYTCLSNWSNNFQFDQIIRLLQHLRP